MGRFDDLETFVAVATTLSFTEAASRLGLTPSAVSKAVQRLESRLGVPLVRRTTRTMNLTDEGSVLAGRSELVLGQLREAEQAVGARANEPRGRVRIDTTVALGTLVIVPALPRLFARYPELEVDLTMRNHLVAVVDEGLDMVVRIGALRPSSLISRHLGTARFITCAAPMYLRRSGRPSAPDALREHSCLTYLQDGRPAEWQLQSGGKEITIAVAGRLRTNSGEALRHAATAGLGIVQLFDFIVADSLKEGELEPVLEDFAPRPLPITALLPPNRPSAPRVRAVLGFLSGLFHRR